MIWNRMNGEEHIRQAGEDLVDYNFRKPELHFPEWLRHFPRRCNLAFATSIHYHHWPSSLAIMQRIIDYSYLIYILNPPRTILKNNIFQILEELTEEIGGLTTDNKAVILKKRSHRIAKVLCTLTHLFITIFSDHVEATCSNISLFPLRGLEEGHDDGHDFRENWSISLLT